MGEKGEAVDGADSKGLDGKGMIRGSRRGEGERAGGARWMFYNLG
jgi:hypothetical protein